MQKLFLISLISVFFLLPFENTRVILFGVPVYVVEIGVIVSTVALFLTDSSPSQKRGSRRHQLSKNILQIFFTRRLFSASGDCLPAGRHGIPAFAGMTREKTVILLLLLGVLSSALVAEFSKSAICPLSHEGFLRALGILKSWFVFPVLFGWILFRASDRYFSREKLLFIFTVSFLPVSILSLLGWIFGSGMTYDNRLAGTFNSPNALAMYLTPAIILSWYFFRKYLSLTKRDAKSCVSTKFMYFLRSQKFIIYHLSFIILLLSLLFLTRSISAWIAVATGIFFFEYMARITLQDGVWNPVRMFLQTISTAEMKRAGYKPTLAWRANNYSPLRYIAAFLVCIGMIVLSQWNTPRFEHFFDPDLRSSFASRLMIWKSAKTMIVDSPLFGIGPGNFGSCYLSYQKYFPPYLEWSVPEPHNIFLAFWLGSGLLGLFSFSFLLLWWFRTIFSEIKKGGNRLILSALTTIMLAILIHGLFDTTYWRMSLAYMFWIVFFAGISSTKTQRDAKSCASTTCPSSNVITN